MATNHTTNYQLNLWEPEDSFLREEFNENSQKIDGALGALAQELETTCRITVGRYRGTTDSLSTGSQTITLGFRPKAVLVWGNYTDNDLTRMGQYNGMAIDGGSLSSGGTCLAIGDEGFTAYSGERYPKLNSSSYYYFYLALR